MASFGEKLKHERESRHTPLEDVARRTRIGIEYLEALERGDFGGLPGRRGFGKLYIRVYADLFGFDPEPLISEYERERLEQELPRRPAPRAEPKHPRKIRFVPRARKPSTTGTASQPPAASAEKAVPAPPTSPVPASEPLDRPVDSPEPGPVETAVARSVASERPPEPEMVFDANPIEAAASPTTQAGVPMAAGAPSWNRRLAGGIVVLLVIGALGVAWNLRTSRPVDVLDPGSSAATATEEDDVEVGPHAAGPVDDHAPPADLPVEPVAAPSPDPPGGSAAPDLPAPRSIDSGPLEVSEFELGTGVVDRRVVNAGREFEEGTVASFLTRIHGGAPGQTIFHAWIREGRLVQNIPLRLGGSNWRTYSRKKLWGTGGWAVEARDENGDVLARVEFRCVPSGG